MDQGLFKRTRVLFVDDDINTLEGYRRAFSCIDSDWLICFSKNATEALIMADNEPFEAIITDLNMPDMHGAELLAHFSCRHPTTLRVAISGYYDASMTFAITACPHKYLAKPSEASLIYAEVSKWLDGDMFSQGSHPSYIETKYV